MTPYMSGKLAPNRTHFTRGLVKYVPRRAILCRPLQNRVKFATSLTPQPLNDAMNGYACPKALLAPPPGLSPSCDSSRAVSITSECTSMMLSGSDDSSITHVATLATFFARLRLHNLKLYPNETRIGVARVNYWDTSSPKTVYASTAIKSPH